MSAAKANKAIPFALESKLLDDIEELEFFIQKSAEANKWQVLIIKKSVLSDIQAKLQKAKCAPLAVLPDFMLLPIDADMVHYIEDDGVINYRLNKFEGGTLSTKIFNKIHSQKSQIIASKRDYNPQNIINLLASNAQKLLLKYLSPWYLPLAIIAVILILSSTKDLIENYQIAPQIKVQKIANIKKFKQIFPKTKRIIDMRAQTKQKLLSRSKQKQTYQNGFLSQLADYKKPRGEVKEVLFKNHKLTIKTGK